MTADGVLPALLEQRRHQTRSALTRRGWVLLVSLLGLGLSALGLFASISSWREGVRPSPLTLIVLAFGFISFGVVLGACLIWLFRAKARIVPYFARELGPYPGESAVAFGRGHDLYRSSAALDRLAATLGVRPLSTFGFGDDLYEQPVHWSPPSEGLRTVEALRAGLGGCPSAGPDIARDLDALASVLRIAVAQGVGFALLLRLGGGDAQSAGVFEARSRVGRFW